MFHFWPFFTLTHTRTFDTRFSLVYTNVSCFDPFTFKSALPILLLLPSQKSTMINSRCGRDPPFKLLKTHVLHVLTLSLNLLCQSSFSSPSSSSYTSLPTQVTNEIFFNHSLTKLFLFHVLTLSPNLLCQSSFSLPLLLLHQPPLSRIVAASKAQTLLPFALYFLDRPHVWQ